MAAPRTVLAAALRPMLPKTWKIIGSDRAVDVAKHITVQLKQRRIIRTPESPQGSHDLEFIVTVTSPHMDVTRAEDQLDDAIDTVVHAIDQAGIRWTGAEKVLNDDRLAYDITLTITSTKEN